MKSSIEKELSDNGILEYRIQGISMLPMIRQNKDIVLITRKEAIDRCKKYDVVLFQRDDGKYVLHRVIKVIEQGYIILGDNCDCEEYVSEEHVLGIMTEMNRGGKRIKMTSKGCMVYARLWCALYPIRKMHMLLKKKLHRIVPLWVKKMIRKRR